jgi:hypothetical protein
MDSLFDGFDLIESGLLFADTEGNSGILDHAQPLEVIQLCNEEIVHGFPVLGHTRVTE